MRKTFPPRPESSFASPRPLYWDPPLWHFGGLIPSAHVLQMDKSSLIRQVKAGLSVNTDPLEEVFAGILQTLNCHEAIVSRVPQIEAAHCDLRKELNRLRLTLDSIKGRIDNENDTTEESLNELFPVESGVNMSPANQGHAFVETNMDKSISYGVRKCDVRPVQSCSANDNAVATSLREIKSTVHRLQQDRDDSIMSSTELDGSISSLREDLFRMQQKLSSSASIEQMLTLQKSLAAQYGQAEEQLQELKTNVHDEVEQSINQKMLEVKACVTELEALAKQRQTKLEQRLASCAREYDVVVFREGIESDVASLVRKVSFLDETAKAQGKTLVALQQKNAIAVLHRHYTIWKNHALAAGLSRWRQVVKRQIQYKDGKESQKRILRKTLTSIMSRRKRFGLERWFQYREWHRKVEQKKLTASKLICDRLGLYLTTPKVELFNRWRRLTIVDKMNCNRGRDVVIGTNSEFAPSIQSVAVARHTETPRLDQNNIMGAFGRDLQGAMYALANEVESIKSHDIASLREIWCTENKRLVSSMYTSLDEAIQKMDESANIFQATTKECVDSRTDDLPALRSKLSELSDLFQCSKDSLKSVDDMHTNLIDALVVREHQLEERLHHVEERARTSFLQITSIMDDQTRFNESIQYLRETIVNNEKRHDEERRYLEQALNHFGEELLNTKVTLGHTRVACDTLEKDLTEAKSELVHFQDTCQSENDMIHDHIHHPGLQKPALERVVNVGHAYEAIAKEKNYVTGINVTATLRTTTTMTMKRCEEKVNKAEDVYIPSEIASFAQDFATWVAWKADHESLLRLIAGTNPEDQMYAEDDNASRRNDLCSELKSELGTLLEQASSSSCLSNDSASCTTTARGLGIRWEARAIFLARVADAINAALSKHDLIILPASTRIGRVRPTSSTSATVCVACDRPMRLKTSRSSTPAKETKAVTQTMKDVSALVEDCGDHHRGEGINSLGKTDA